MTSPTLSDVARAAGVSYATADRVINNRGNVADKSIAKVREAVTSASASAAVGTRVSLLGAMIVVGTGRLAPHPMADELRRAPSHGLR